jgi:hypothetical protein
MQNPCRRQAIITLGANATTCRRIIITVEGEAVTDEAFFDELEAHEAEMIEHDRFTCPWEVYCDAMEDYGTMIGDDYGY